MQTSGDAHDTNKAASGSGHSVPSPAPSPPPASTERDDMFLRRMLEDDSDATQDVRDISMKEASLLRLDGCRVRRTRTSSPASPAPAASLVPPCQSSEPDLAGLARVGLRFGGHPASRSPYNGALETSQAILENMAADTAASVASNRRTPETVRLSPRNAALATSSAALGHAAVTAGTDVPTLHDRTLAHGRPLSGDPAPPGPYTANAMIRRQASFFSSSTVRSEAPDSLDSGKVAAQAGARHGAPSDASRPTLGTVLRPADPVPVVQLGSPTAPAAYSVSEMLTAAETAAGAGVLRQHYAARKLPLPGETYDANHDLQHLFEKLNAQNLTGANRLNAHDDDEEEIEMNTVLYNLRGTATTAAAARQCAARPSEIPLPPTPDMAVVKADASGTHQQTPLVPFQTWRFPNLGGKTREAALSPYSAVQTPGHASRQQRAASHHGHGDANGASLLSPVDWRGSQPGAEEHSTRPWSEASSPVSSHKAKAPHRKGTVSPQLLQRALDRRRASSTQDSNAADTPFHPPRKSVTFPSAAPDDSLYAKSHSQSYHRTLDMVCSAYERLQRRQQQSQHSRKTVVSARTSTRASSTTSPAMTAAPASATAFPRSPSLSASLLRSSGYYSFGKRISLSHYNRQTIGEVPPFLGSMSNLHVGTGAKDRSMAVTDVSLSLPAVPRRSTRRLSNATLNRIKSRPLLQTTLFVQHTMASIHAPSTSSSDLSPRPQRSVTTAPGFSMTELTTVSSTDAPHQASATHRSFFQAADADTQPSDSNSTSAPPDHGTSSSHLGRASNSSRVTLLEVDALAEASEASARRAQDGANTVAKPPFTSPTHATTAAAAAAGNYAEVSPAASTGLRRALTEVGQLQRHVHTIDEIEREVDNENGDLVVHVGMLLMGWLEVVSLLGCGSFGQVFLCKDIRTSDGHFVHPAEIDGEDFAYWNCSHAYLPFGDCDNPPTHDPLVAVKVVKSIPLLENQSVLESEMLVLIGAQTAEPARMLDDEAAAEGDSQDGLGTLSSANGGMPDPPDPDPRCQYVTKVLADGTCYGHHCIIMERYGANLYEYVERNDHNGLPMYQIRSVGQQLFSALTLLHDRCHIIHADIKPENMLLTMDSCRSNVTLNRPADDVTGAELVEGAAATADADGAVPGPAVPHRDAQKSADALEATPMEKSLLLLGKSAISPSASVVQTANGIVTEKMHMLAPQPVRVQALNQPFHTSTGPSDGNGWPRTQNARAESAGAMPTSIIDVPETSSAKGPSSAARLQVKLIDFSSSCYDGGPFYTYIQSRYYRAPEVIVGGSYGSAIDMWSAGCLLAELLLGIPLLPGCNDHHQLTLIQETIGPLPPLVLQGGSETMRFYTYSEDPPAAAAINEEAEAEEGAHAAAPPGAAPANTPGAFQLVSREEFFRRAEMEPMEYRRFFTHKTLPELVRHCPLSLEERRMSNGLPPYAPSTDPAGKEANKPVPNQTTRAEILKQRFHLFDLLRSLLHPDPSQRLTASQALQHPFFTTDWTYLSTNGLN